MAAVLSLLWREVECPLHSSEQIATRAAEHGGGGENYTDGRRTDRQTALFKERGNASVCLELWIGENTDADELRSFIYSGAHSSGKREEEEKKYVGGNRRNQIQNRRLTRLRCVAAGFSPEMRLPLA